MKNALDREPVGIISPSVLYLERKYLRNIQTQFDR